MKLQIKAAGLCGTGAFVLATYPAVFHNEDPLVILSFAVPAAAAMALLGYLIGDILANPKGHLERHRKGGLFAKLAGKAPGQRGKAAVTGEESFLDDMPSEVLPIEPSKAED